MKNYNMTINKRSTNNLEPYISVLMDHLLPDNAIGSSIIFGTT